MRPAGGSVLKYRVFEDVPFLADHPAIQDEILSKPRSKRGAERAGAWTNNNQRKQISWDGMVQNAIASCVCSKKQEIPMKLQISVRLNAKIGIFAKGRVFIKYSPI